MLRAWCSDELGARVVRESAGEGVGGSRRWLLVSGLPAQRSGELGGRVPQGSFRRPGVRRVSAASRLRPGGAALLAAQRQERRGELWPELNKMAFWGGCCGIPGWRLRSTSYKIVSCRST